MDTVINKISEVESAASAIMDEANNQKKVFAESMNDKTMAFDRELEIETNKKLKALQAQMKTEMEARLAEQKDFVEHLLMKLEHNYEEHHNQYVERLFQQLLED